MGSVYRRKVRFCATCRRRLDTTHARTTCETAGHAIEVREQGVWWVRYHAGGRQVCVSSRSRHQADAERLLREREGVPPPVIVTPAPVGPVTFEEAADDLFTDYRINEKRSLKTIRQKVEIHLRPVFGGWPMSAITTGLMRQFSARRQEAGASNAEINRELGALRRMFTLAVQNGRLVTRPYVPMLKERGARAGFFELEQFESVSAHLKPHYQGIVSFAYVTGWRTPSEILPLQWRQVDMQAGEVRLDPGTTKNGQGRVFPFTTQLRRILESQRQAAEELTQRGINAQYVFFHLVGKKTGQRITEDGFAKAWQTARVAAGCPERIVHDLRRTAVRNLVRAGVPERVAMQLTGHKTRAVFERYNIVSQGDLSDAAQRLDRFAAGG